MMDGIIQHFRKDELPFIEMASGWARETEDMYSPKLTNFLDPRQVFITESVVRSYGLNVSFDGGFPNAERVRVMIHPDYYEPESSDFQLLLFEVIYPEKFLTIEHKDVLGSLMSLGIDRSIFGDIRIDEGTVQFAAASEMRDYLTANFTSVGKAKIRIEEVIDADALIPLSDTYIEEMHIVSSLRLDAVAASLTGLSRQKASSLVKGERVKVNHAVRTETSFELNESDLLSIRGHGRFKVGMIEGRTRKDKIRLSVGRLQ